MNAKMRIGHFTTLRRLTLRVKMAGFKTVVISGMLAAGIAQSMAAGLPGHDTNLERWAKESLAKRMGDMRDGYHADETLRMVTEIDIKRGPLPLSAERNNEPLKLLANLYFGAQSPAPLEAVATEPESAIGPFPPRRPYAGALVLAQN